MGGIPQCQSPLSPCEIISLDYVGPICPVVKDNDSQYRYYLSGVALRCVASLIESIISHVGML